MTGSGSGDEDGLIRAARAFRDGRIDRRALLDFVETWASVDPAADGGDARAGAGAGPGPDPNETIALDETTAFPGGVRGPDAGPDAPTQGGTGTRFEVLDLHAEGGLGSVYRAIDAELGREVALKQIRPERADDPESRARFEREGTITGALEHPGIVPVYGRGRFDDGRPFFAMRLVRGRSLREAIADLHRNGSPGPAGPHAGSTLRSLVGRLVQACLAVEYAHSRGVVHRDLKPENILLGPFGETLVVDWGLARSGATGAPDPIGPGPTAPPPPAGRPGPDPASSPVHGASGGRIPAGGTPAGPPGPASDPSPPRPEPGGRGTEHDPPARRAAPHPADDPTEPDGGTAPWAAGPGVVEASEADSWATRAGHVRGTIGYMSPEQARGDHRAVGRRSDVFGLGASLYCLLAGRAPISGADGMYASLSRAIRGEVEPPGALRDGVDPDLERICLKAIDPDPARRYPTARALAEALDEWLAEERARTARALFTSALEAYAALVTTVEDRLGSLPAAREAREELLSTAVSGLEGLIEHAERGQSAEVERALAEAHRQLGEIALRLGRSAEAHGHFERSLRAFEALVGSGRPEPGDRRGYSVVLGRLGDVSRRRGDTASALRFYRRGLVAARALAAVETRSGRAQRGLAIAYGKLGDLARQSGDPARARTYIRRSLAIAESLARLAPEAGEATRGVAMALDKLGDVERQLGALDAALDYYRRALSVAESLASSRPDDPASSRGVIISGNKLGSLLRLSGDLDGARAAFGRSMSLAEARAEADPQDVDARRDLAICCDRLGDVCRRSGDLPAASAHYGRGLSLARSLLDADPDSAQARRGTAIALNKLGELHRLSGDLDGAARVHREALALIGPLADSSPDDVQVQLDAAHACQRLGDLDASSGRPDAARTWYDLALARLRPLAARGILPPSCEGWIEALEGPMPGGGGPRPSS
ncbi:serine/threonine-protein kinase [Tautonia plasticadhaerens]|uniref:Serine/threonine-protein kinase PknD n=1 Tax=Tautonia plasticadhaerens TaxID=2527974 RepID=A0A518GVD8_9BACT|nr:serine/threonine-protein kinase [Tautonia plasticadhaerens]QDV32557.1 Serine/threonine-protein kinase PknD [Tautonia plasticadhaerens]